jgi:hypothetical protein
MKNLSVIIMTDKVSKAEVTEVYLLKGCEKGG